MKKSLLLLALSLAALASAGEIKKGIRFYDQGFPRTGDVKYLEEICSLDLYLPDEMKPGFSTIVWFHGGGLKGTAHTKFPERLRNPQIAVAVVNYRGTGPRAKCPDYIYDAAASAAWVKKHIKEYEGDPRKVYISGRSAGGYLTAMLALQPKYLKSFGCKPEDFAAYFPISGQMTTHFQILNERREKDPSTPEILLDEYAPIFLAHANVPPLYLLVGDSELDMPGRAEENMLLAARLRRNFGCKNVYCYSFPTFNHTRASIPGAAFMLKTIKDLQNK